MHHYDVLEIGNVSWHQTHVVFCHIFALVFAIELNSNTYRFKVFPLIFVTYISKSISGWLNCRNIFSRFSNVFLCKFFRFLTLKHFQSWSHTPHQTIPSHLPLEICFKESNSCGLLNLRRQWSDWWKSTKVTHAFTLEIKIHLLTLIFQFKRTSW